MSDTRAETTTKSKGGLFSGGFDPVGLLLEGRAFFGLIAIILVFSYLSPNYLTVGNLLTMSSHVAIYGLLGLGMLLVILNGGIDLSVGSTLGLCGVMAGFFIHGVELAPLGVTLYPPIWVIVILVCGVGGLVGLVNGILIARFKVPPFVATLGSLYAVRGIALLITNGLTYNNLGGKEALGNTGFDWLGFNRLLNIPVGVLVMIGVALIMSVVLNKTAFGRWLYASGGNERAARLSGVPVKRVKISVYVLSGVCAGIAGLVLSSELTSAGPTAGTTYELTAIATVVIGGAALTGGIGNVRGTLLGAFVIGFLSDGLVIVGVSAYWQMVFTGAVIVLAVLLNSIDYRGGAKKKSKSTPSNGTPAAKTGDPGQTKSGDTQQQVPQKTAG
ncbi:ABC transporter permease [Salinisphaera sp. SPP-AMP-43]|uniref:ABC transporter permease n=1 Tax=Salinisphaera sp. SPP-AMP-43 TaxID=3121288 RepID=UPI003C6DCAAA